MNVLFAPDWREGNAYQALLADALRDEGVEVTFASQYRRGLPLTRMVAEAHVDLVHLHWPEAYCRGGGRFSQWIRPRRFGWDLAWASTRTPLVTTAHNLVPHGSERGSLSYRNQRRVYRAAKCVFAHSEQAAAELQAEFGIDPGRIPLIPHGDLSVTLGDPLPRQAARRRLQQPDVPLCLMVGVVRPYKGIEAVIAHWRRHSPAARLVIVGQPMPEDYGRQLQALAQGDPNIALRLERVTDVEMGVWLSAADCVLFNYTQVLTSGAAPLARSRGVPVLLPRRLTSVDLDEPHPQVFRFGDLDTDFPAVLERALAAGSDWNAARDWREKTSWSRVAELTAAAYRRVLQPRTTIEVTRVTVAS